MKIVGIEIVPLSFAFQKTYTTSYGLHHWIPDILLKIYTDEGITGLGEGLPGAWGPLYTGESPGSMIDILTKYVFPRALDGENPFNVDIIHQKMDGAVYGHYVAKAAVDYAIHDIMGKALGLPVCQLVGGCHADKIPVWGDVALGDPKKMEEEAREVVEAGYKAAIKTKTGPDMDASVKGVEAIRKAVGPDVPIDVDVNCGYLPKQAIEFSKRVEEFAPVWIEQPTDRDDVDGMALVKNNTILPVGACESAVTLPQILRVIKAEAADFVNYKIDRSGGFFRGRQAVHMIHTAGLFAVGSENLGLGISVAAKAHFAASTSLVQHHSYGHGLRKVAGRLDTRNMEGDILLNTPLVADGFLHVPTGPGLGVELDEKAVVEYARGESPVLAGKKTE